VVTQVPAAHQEEPVRVDLAVTRQRVLGQVATPDIQGAASVATQAVALAVIQDTLALALVVTLVTQV